MNNVITRVSSKWKGLRQLWLKLFQNSEYKPEQPVGLSFREIVNSLYLGILERDAEKKGLEAGILDLQHGTPLSEIVRKMITSDEFQFRLPPAQESTVVLPDLTKMYPDKYFVNKAGMLIYLAPRDEDFAFMESLIMKHRYYDSLGVWAPKIDLDKRVTASIVEGLGARSCLELGCYSGSVLSLLAERSIDVCGVEVSHRAFMLAYPNIYQNIRFGNFLDLEFDRTYDLVLCMDILEHVSPLSLDRYIARMTDLLSSHGYVYINSPMHGSDEVFGEMIAAYLPEWQQAGKDVFWRHLDCDAKGWPLHGHLIWADPKWWETTFQHHGLVRDKEIEKVLHALLENFFKTMAPARKSFFVLRRADFHPDIENVRKNLERVISPVVAELL